MAEVIIISGRAGSGKTSTAFEVAEQLKRRDLRHALIDADFLDAMHPEAPGAELMLANLTAVWANYHRRGVRRLVIAGTAVAMEAEGVREAVAAASGDVRVTAVVLTVSDEVARARLTKREVGSELDHCLQSSNKMARVLDETVPGAVRVDADRHVQVVALHVLRVVGWIDS